MPRRRQQLRQERPRRRHIPLLVLSLGVDQAETVLADKEGWVVIMSSFAEITPLGGEPLAQNTFEFQKRRIGASTQRNPFRNLLIQGSTPRFLRFTQGCFKRLFGSRRLDLAHSQVFLLDQPGAELGITVSPACYDIDVRRITPDPRFQLWGQHDRPPPLAPNRAGKRLVERCLEVLRRRGFPSASHVVEYEQPMAIVRR